VVAWGQASEGDKMSRKSVIFTDWRRTARSIVLQKKKFVLQKIELSVLGKTRLKCVIPSGGCPPHPILI